MNKRSKDEDEQSRMRLYVLMFLIFICFLHSAGKEKLVFILVGEGLGNTSQFYPVLASDTALQKQAKSINLNEFIYPSVIFSFLVIIVM